VGINQNWLFLSYLFIYFFQIKFYVLPHSIKKKKVILLFNILCLEFYFYIK
jgi:hypothetical protein